MLILDEVLSVGDETFQQKCLARLTDYCRSGTAIILVSHLMDTVAAYCNRAAWLDHGELKSIGKPDQVIRDYRARNKDKHEI